MPDIELMGATYPGVPSVILPTSGGGTAEFFDMSGDMAWLGKDATCLNSNIYSMTDTLDNTSFATWTPSTTAKTILATANVGTFAADLENYEYYLVWECGCDMAYTGTPTLKAHFLFSRCYIVQEIMKRPSSFANIEIDSFNGNNCVSLYSSNFLRYYGTTTGSMTYTWAASYGIYFGASAATFSNSTSNTPTVTMKRPTLGARCSDTYFSTGNAELVDQDDSEFFMRGKLYRIRRNGTINCIYQKIVDLINE